MVSSYSTVYKTMSLKRQEFRIGDEILLLFLPTNPTVKNNQSFHQRQKNSLLKRSKNNLEFAKSSEGYRWGNFFLLLFFLNERRGGTIYVYSLREASVKHLDGENGNYDHHICVLSLLQPYSAKAN